MTTRKIVPRGDNEGGLGTALKRWASAFIANITVTTINALILTAQEVNFTITGGTTSKTLTVDETVAMSDKAPKTDTIKGDGTAGRVLRIINLILIDGTAASTIKASTATIWAGNTYAQEDNLGKPATGTNFNLNTNGDTLTIKFGNCLGTLAWSMGYNEAALYSINLAMVSGNLVLTFYVAATSAVYDLTAQLDSAKQTNIIIAYITSS